MYFWIYMYDSSDNDFSNLAHGTWEFTYFLTYSGLYS